MDRKYGIQDLQNNDGLQMFKVAETSPAWARKLLLGKVFTRIEDAENILKEVWEHMDKAYPEQSHGIKQKIGEYFIKHTGNSLNKTKSNHNDKDIRTEVKRFGNRDGESNVG